MNDDVKKDKFLNSEPADELSRQLTDVRLRHFKVNLKNVSHDPDLARLAVTVNASKPKRKTKTAVSEGDLKKLAGL